MSEAGAARKAAIAHNMSTIRQRMAAAAGRLGRGADSVRLVAVTKGRPIEEIRALYECGVRDMGENRIQDALPHIEAMPADITWHLIGHLQRNKSKPALQNFKMIHSVDSIRLGDELEKQAATLNLQIPILFEVNISGEESKYGFRPDEAKAALAAAGGWPHLRVTGLMTMAPYDAEPESTRPVFRGLRQLRDDLRVHAPGGEELAELSMGMTNDFEVAIEEGATMVRIGSALFQ